MICVTIDGKHKRLFEKDACLKHGLNISLAECSDESDMLDCYKPAKKISFDDMSEVVF